MPRFVDKRLLKLHEKPLAERAAWVEARMAEEALHLQTLDPEVAHAPSVCVFVVRDSADCPPIKNTLLFLRRDATIGELMIHLRRDKTMAIPHAVFLYIPAQKIIDVDGMIMLDNKARVGVVHDNYKSPDGILYVYMRLELTVG